MEKHNEIFIACSVGDLNWLKRSLLGREHLIGKIVNHEGLTPLHLAARCRHADLLEYLMDNCTGIDASVATFDTGETPLHSLLEAECCQNGDSTQCLKCVKVLLERGANCSKTNKKLQTPLHLAAEKGIVSVVEAMLSYGASIIAKDSNNYTPLALAKLNGHYECSRLLQALHWAKQKDATAQAKLHIERTLEEQKKVQLALENEVRQQENEEAYRQWLERKRFQMVEIPENCIHRKFERVSSHESKCQSCPSSGNQTGFKSVPDTCTHGTPSCQNADTSANQRMVKRIELSFDQAERNIMAVGKPEKLYPYANYPPNHYRSQMQHLSNSRPSSSHSVRHRNGRSVSKVSVKSMPTSSKSRPSPVPKTRPARQSRSCPSSPIPHYEYMPPTSSMDHNIHKPDCDIHDSRPVAKPMNTECMNGFHGEVNKAQFASDNRDEETEDDEDGSTSSIDGLTFHEVGPENNLETLINAPVSRETGKAVPFINPAELIELFRLQNSHPKLHHRRSTGTHLGTHRSRYHRTTSLGSIPEGEIVTKYDDHREGSRIFDEKFLSSLMPYAFAEQITELEQEIRGSTLTENTSEEVLENGTRNIDNSDHHHNISCPTTNGIPETLKVVTVAWDNETKEVRTTKVEEKKMTLKPALHSVSNNFSSTSDTSISQSTKHTVKTMKQRVKSAVPSYKSSRGVTASRNKHKASVPAEKMSNKQLGVALKPSLFEFGGDLIYN